MKKTIIAGIVLGLSLMGASASIDVNLKYGMKNDSVIELQDFLIDRGLLTGNSTGFFGLMTLKAVKTYQISQNLPSTGYVGSMTRSAINAQIALDTASSSEQASLEDPTSTSPTPTGSAPQEIVQSPAVVSPVNTTQVSAPAPIQTPQYTVNVVLGEKDSASSTPVKVYILDSNGNWTAKYSVHVKTSDGQGEIPPSGIVRTGSNPGYYPTAFTPAWYRENWIEITVPELNYVNRVTF